MGEGHGIAPGGAANLAVAAARLGLRTGLSSGFGDDAYGQWAWSLLQAQEHIDLSRSRIFPGWHSAVTVSLATRGDRSMITHGHPTPISQLQMIGTLPTSRAFMTELVVQGDETPWWLGASDSGALVFADVGWDPTGRWDPAVLSNLDQCHAFLPNHVEAMQYTRTSTPDAALAALSERVPLAIITRGKDGAIAVDSTTGETASVGSLDVVSLDPTGAGDVFAAGIVVGTLGGWPLEQRLLFSALCSALAVQNFGGSLASPGWGDIADWWEDTKTCARDTAAGAELAHRYGFLDDLVRDQSRDAVRRAEATFGLLTEAEEHVRSNHRAPVSPPRIHP